MLSGGPAAGGPGPQVRVYEQSVGWILARWLIPLCFWRTLPFQGLNYAQLPLVGGNEGDREEGVAVWLGQP